MNPKDPSFVAGLEHGRGAKERGKKYAEGNALASALICYPPIPPRDLLSYISGYCIGAQLPEMHLQTEKRKGAVYIARRERRFCRGLAKEVRKQDSSINAAHRWFGDPGSVHLRFVTSKRGGKFKQGPAFDESTAKGVK